MAVCLLLTFGKIFTKCFKYFVLTCHSQLNISVFVTIKYYTTSRERHLLHLTDTCAHILLDPPPLPRKIPIERISNKSVLQL